MHPAPCKPMVYRMAPPPTRHRVLPRALLEQFTRRGNEEVGVKPPPRGFVCCCGTAARPCNICAETGFKTCWNGRGQRGGLASFWMFTIFQRVECVWDFRGPAGFGAPAERFCGTKLLRRRCRDVHSYSYLALGPRASGPLGDPDRASVVGLGLGPHTHTTSFTVLVLFYSF